MTDLTPRLIDYISSVGVEMIPEDAIDAARVQILDSLGVGLAGNQAAGIPELTEVISVWGGKAESTVLGCGLALPAPNAAQINASMIHALDFDDGHPEALMHPSVITVTTALAVAELVGNVSGRELLAVVAMGTDLICRLGMAVQSDVPKPVTGWHFTSIFGFLASAAVAGRLLRLSPQQMHSAVGIAYHQSAGNLQCARDGALTKRLGPGFAVRGGITSALLAASGITGAAGWLEGEVGLYQQYFKKPCDASVLLSGLGERFEGINVGTKRYPCCGIVHPFVDAALELVPELNAGSFEVEGVTVFHGAGSRFLVEPLDAKREPRNIVDAQFSVPWAVAAALLQGKVSLENFTDSGIGNEKIRSLSSRIEVVFDDDMTRSDGLEAGRVEVRFADGSSRSASSDNRMNSGGDRITFEECDAKFRECVNISGLNFSPDRARQIVAAVDSLAELADVSQLTALLQPK